MSYDNLFGNDASADPLKALDKRPKPEPAGLLVPKPPAAGSAAQPATILDSALDLSPRPGDSAADTVLDELMQGDSEAGKKHSNLFDGI